MGNGRTPPERGDQGFLVTPDVVFEQMQEVSEVLRELHGSVREIDARTHERHQADTQSLDQLRVAVKAVDQKLDVQADRYDTRLRRLEYTVLAMAASLSALGVKLWGPQIGTALAAIAAGAHI